MKTFRVTLVLVGFASSLFVGSASALPPFNKEWLDKYVEGNPKPEFVKRVGTGTASCLVCHVGKNRKDKNDYGKAVGKYLTKKEYNAVKDNAAKAKKYVEDGLEKAETEKSAGGKSYGELIKEGTLPGEAAP